jgi:5-(carboxyamino)imidazole ribonucleotide synthase
VHNSGHFTLDAARTSQFENHWRALLGLELGSMATSPFFGMVNVLGPDGPAALIDKPFTMSSEGIMSYWYDKCESRPGRKLGHVNVFADSEAEFSQRLSRAKFAVAEWQEQMS